ncbi:hypothetical protein [Streptomyces sp. NPDC015130]|uniref:hypothetical protein n=1 Tax=Streptomyces sp. NPDC015130 TaxID=3364940 RepID=UPI003701EDC5
MRDAHESVLLHVHGTAEHLRSLGVALEHSPTVIPAFTLARGVLDQACDPWYRMEPGVDPDTRVRRYMNAELKSHKEVLNSMAGLKDSSAEAAQAAAAAEARIQAIKDTAEELGWEVRTPKKATSPTPASIVTEHKDGSVPSTTDLAEDIAPGIGKLSWRLHSAVAHGVGYGLAMLLDKDDTGAGPVAQTDRQAAARYAIAPISYLNLVRRIYIQFGWSRTKQQKLWNRVGEVWAEESGVTLPPVPPALQA